MPFLACCSPSSVVAALAAAAGGAVSIPIIIHLLNRKRFRVVTWAAMRFLLAAQRKNTRRMRLEQLILLAVRCLMVLLLVLAMASVTPWAEAAVAAALPRAARPSPAGRRPAHAQDPRPRRLVQHGAQGRRRHLLRARPATGQRRSSASRRRRRLQRRPHGRAAARASCPSRPRTPRKVADEIETLRLPHGNADLVATLNTVEDMLRQIAGQIRGARSLLPHRPAAARPGPPASRGDPTPTAAAEDPGPGPHHLRGRRPGRRQQPGRHQPDPGEPLATTGR